MLPDLRAAAELALSEYRAETLQYGVRPGLPELREWISGYLHGEGAEVPAEEVVVVNGAKHGIDLLCRLLLDEGDSIVVTAPTYFTAIPIFKSFGASFIEVSQDEEGLDTSELEAVLARLVREGRRLPKFIYNVPDFHNPTGVTMSRRRREALVELSARHRILILEDSPYRKVRFEGAPEPMIKALDRANTILIGTFAKLIAPGLRIGWVSASTDALARIIQLKSDGGSCPLTQRIIVEFCRAGGLDAHIQSVQRTYGSHRDHMVAAVRRQLPELSMTVPHGGYYLWLKLPEGMDGDELTTRAADAGVTILAGSKFFAGQPQKNYIRLAYSHATPVQIDEGVGRLAGALRSMASTSARA
ncbi:MAG: PLP-dependent aminotransferase family protein [Acidobacteria bacterium]|nr:PLP-dependent aminotransferase family protein [Acidobacteriota bacterium]